MNFAKLGEHEWPMLKAPEDTHLPSRHLLQRFKDDAGFKKVAERLMAEIMRRDQEDGDKLAKGIQLAIDKKASMFMVVYLGDGVM